jgi:hypothetical protein
MLFITSSEETEGSKSVNGTNARGRGTLAVITYIISKLKIEIIN